MNDLVQHSAYFGVVISVAAYALGILIKKKLKLAIFNPLFLSIIFIIVFLLAGDIEYANYEKSANLLSYLLTPATVCLAVPLYRQIEVLKKNKLVVLLGLGSGVVSSLATVFILSILLGFSNEMFVTLLPKSVTTAIGMEVASELGGDSTIAAAVIIVTGIVGNMSADIICRVFRIKDPVAIGLAVGCSSHAVGTARALEMGEVQGAMSSLAVAVSGIMTVILAPLFSMLSV